MKKNIVCCVVLSVAVILLSVSVSCVGIRLRALEKVQADKVARYEKDYRAYLDESWRTVGYNEAVVDSWRGKISKKDYPEEPRLEDYL